MWGSQPSLTWAEYKERRAKGETMLLLDVREQDEWEAGHLPGAEHIPLGSLEFKLWQKTYPKNTIIVVYCQTGRRSSLARKMFKDHGYQHVFSLNGGYLAATT